MSKTIKEEGYNKKDSSNKEEGYNKEEASNKKEAFSKKEASNKKVAFDNVNFWINDPYILFNQKYLFDLWPLEHMTKEEKLNAISRFVIFATIIGTFLFHNVKILVTGCVTLFILIFLYYVLHNRNLESTKKMKQGFSNKEYYEKYKNNFTNPTKQNPLMNVSLPEIGDNPNRPEAAPAYNEAVKEKIEESLINMVSDNFNDPNVKSKLFGDLGDKFEFEGSMRQFYSTANTRVPNNQKEFAQFCYGNMASCKDGDVEMCLKNAPRHTNM